MPLATDSRSIDQRVKELKIATEERKQGIIDTLKKKHEPSKYHTIEPSARLEIGLFDYNYVYHIFNIDIKFDWKPSSWPNLWYV